MYGTTGSPTQVWNMLNGGKTGIFTRDRTRDRLGITPAEAETPVTATEPVISTETGALTEYLKELERSGMTFGTSSGSTSYTGNPFEGSVAKGTDTAGGLGLPGWLATGVGQAVKTAGGYAGLSPYVTGPLGAIAQGLASDGDVGGMLKRGVASVAATGANKLLPGYGAQLLGLGAAALRGGSADQLIDLAGNMAISKIASLSVPGIGPVLGVLGALGFDPMRGIRGLLDSTDYAAEGGHGGGFFTKASQYDGYTPGQAYEPGTTKLADNVRGTDNASEFDGYSPGSPVKVSPDSSVKVSQGTSSSGSSTRFTPSNDTYFGGINTGGGNNYRTGNSGSSSSYSSSSSSYSDGSSYSNPASSYGSW